LVASTYLAHGISLSTTVAVASTLLSLVLAAGLSFAAIAAARLTGLGDEAAQDLRLGTSIDLRGLLFGGILIGALGALNDLTTTQSATVFELVHADPASRLRGLWARGMAIGRQHIASLVNTLVLAYAGASLALFVAVSVNPSSVPLWVILNSELFATEIVRSLAGSAGLVLAVPISTLLAALAALRWGGATGHGH
jgi:uncharacterized membrane protein